MVRTVEEMKRDVAALCNNNKDMEAQVIKEITRMAGMTTFWYQSSMFGNERKRRMSESEHEDYFWEVQDIALRVMNEDLYMVWWDLVNSGIHPMFHGPWNHEQIINEPLHKALLQEAA